MKIAEIHEFKESYYNINFSQFDVLTFDDGLYSQFQHLDFFESFNKPLIFFISTGIVSNGIQSDKATHCADAHLKARQNNFEDYMTWQQIEELASKHEVGGHSHTHPDLSKLKFVQQTQAAKKEIDEMMHSFKEHGITISKFCFPYNDRIVGYAHYLKQYGITDLYGDGRISIESAL